MNVQVLQGDSRAILPTLAAHSVDAVVTDPPAGIGFMGKQWDTPGALVQRPPDRSVRWDRTGGNHNPCTPQDKVRTNRTEGAKFRAWLTPILAECLRVLKPGGHALVWALPRTSHWTATALEDAGFEIRDVIVHLYGQGFPKSLDVGKALDKAAGAERAVVGVRPTYRPNSGALRPRDEFQDRSDGCVTAPPTDLARQWDGWGTALKPASEHWILCRAPLSEPTVAANVVRWGTGALNIDGGRLGAVPRTTHADGNHQGSAPQPMDWGKRNGFASAGAAGRWPPNCAISHTLFCEPAGTRRVQSGNGTAGAARPATVGYEGGWQVRPVQPYSNPDGTETVEAWACHETCPVALLDGQSGIKRASNPKGSTSWSRGPGRISHEGWQRPSHAQYAPTEDEGYGDTGGASRFFYVAKASAAERSRGLPDGERNSHPTVKPLALMRWLLTLVVPPGGVVLDPFAGSGSTLVAAAELGLEAIGIEQSAEYCATARQRCEVPV